MNKSHATDLPLERFARPNGIYLLNHSVGVPPASLLSHVADELMPGWLTHPDQAWQQWMAELEGFHTELARLFNHEPEWFCHQANVSSGMTKVLHALKPASSRPVILLSEQAFPSLGYVARAATGTGYQTRYLPAEANAADPETWRKAIAGDVGVVLIGHAESNTGITLPVAEILEVVRDAGALSIVDIAQSAGLLPIDLREWRPDVVVGTSVKWLCGGPGAGFLWVRPDVIDRCRPLDVGWFSHQDPFEFDIRDFRLAPDARRFWGGTPSPIPAALARHSIALINDIGVPAIQQHNQTLTQRLIDGVDEHLLMSPLDVGKRSGTVVIDPGPGQRSALMALLAAAEVHVDERAKGIRISPHIVNTEADIDTTLELLAGAQ